ncbi:MAG: CRISPR-associated endoribonuclease Cas6 [Sarcina sp.]
MKAGEKLNKEFLNIRVRVCLLTDIEEKEVPSIISNLIFFSMTKDTNLEKVHENTGFKGYSFSGGFVPFEKERVYFEGEFYDFNIRTDDEKLGISLAKCLKNLENKDLIVVDVELRKNIITIIDKVYTVSPTIVTLKNKEGRVCSWTKEEGKEKLKRSLVNNLVNKYNFINGTNFVEINPDDIFERIDIKNNYPILVMYKGVKMLGYKYEIKFKQNSIAQELGKVAIILGLGDKNSTIGTGFTKVLYKRGEEKC